MEILRMKSFGAILLCGVMTISLTTFGAENIVQETTGEDEHIETYGQENDCILGYDEEVVVSEEKEETAVGDEDILGLKEASELGNHGYVKLYRSLGEGIEANIIRCMHAVRTTDDGKRISKKVYYKYEKKETVEYFYVYGLEQYESYTLECYDSWHRYLGSAHAAIGYSGYIKQDGEYTYKLTTYSDAVDISCTLAEANGDGTSVTRYLCYEIFDSKGNRLDRVGYKNGDITTTFNVQQLSSDGEFVFHTITAPALECGKSYKLNVWIQTEYPSKYLYENTRFCERTYNILAAATPDIPGANIQNPTHNYSNALVNGTYPIGTVYVTFNLSDDTYFTRRHNNKLYLWDSANEDSEQWDYEIAGTSDKLAKAASFSVDKKIHVGKYKYKALINGVVRTGYLNIDATDTYPQGAYGLGCEISDETSTIGTKITYKLTGQRNGTYYLYPYYYYTEENGVIGSDYVGTYQLLNYNPLELSADNDYTAVVDSTTFTKMIPGAEYKLRLLVQNDKNVYPASFVKVSYYTIQTKDVSPEVEFFTDSNSKKIRVSIEEEAQASSYSAYPQVNLFIKEEGEDFYDYYGAMSLQPVEGGYSEATSIAYNFEEGKKYLLGIRFKGLVMANMPVESDDLLYEIYEFTADSFKSSDESGSNPGGGSGNNPGGGSGNNSGGGSGNNPGGGSGNNSSVNNDDSVSQNAAKVAAVQAAAKAGKGSVDDTLSVITDKKFVLSVNDANGYDGKITVIKGAKLYVGNDLDPKYEIASTNPKKVAVNKKGVITAKAVGSEKITYTSKSSMKRTITINVIDPAVSNAVNATVKKNALTVKPNTDFECLVKIPVSAAYVIKKSRLADLNVSYDASGNLKITGKTGAKGSGSVVFTSCKKKYTVKIKVSNK